MKSVLRCVLAVLITAALTGSIHADCTKPDENSTQPQAASPETDSEPLSPADQILFKMSRHGQKINTVQADFDYEMNQTLLGDIQKRKGKVWHKKPNLFRLEFTTPTKETFVFDGRRLYEKRYAAKQLIIYEIRRPDEKPVESLEIGRSPFPMPFGQKAQAVKQHFEVTLGTPDATNSGATEPDKPAKTQPVPTVEVLVLTPKKKSSLAKDYKKMEFWVDTKTWLPTKIVTVDMSENILTIVFHKTVVNKKVKKNMFTAPAVPADWETIEHLKPKDEVKSPDEVDKKGG